MSRDSTGQKVSGLVEEDKSPSTDPVAPLLAQSQEQGRITEYWSQWASEYETHQAQLRAAKGYAKVWEDIWTGCLPAPPTRVLDVGTGSGEVAFRLARMGHQVTGIDLAEGMLAQARRKAGNSANPLFGFGDAAVPQFSKGSFDALTARYVLWTLRHPDQALVAWLRVLKPGGVLVVVDSLWFPEGLSDWGARRNARGARVEAFRTAYQEQQEHLPLAEADSIEVFAEYIRQAGFTNVTVEELPRLMEQDRKNGVAPGHRVQMQYRIRAVAPE